MKISLFVSHGGWHTQELRKAAQKKCVDFETLKIGSLNDFQKKLKKTGDVIIWFSSILGTLDKKNTFFHLMRKRTLINPDCLKTPFLTRKLFQQKYLESFSSINTLPTFHFLSKKELFLSIPKKLRFPIIQKPNYGSQGNGIVLLKSKRDIAQNKTDFSKYIFQNFIENDGDYRVFIIGGKVLGTVKRTAKNGCFLNNVSQGGTASKVDDPQILKKLRKIALITSSIFELPICGVDIIFDKKLQKFYFMEINTNPEWKGFQEATGINVAEKIVDYCIAINNRKKKSTAILIKEYFDDNYEYLGNQKFHYASRMWFCTKSKLYRHKLDNLKEVYLKNTQEKQLISLKKILEEEIDSENLVAEKIRKKYLEKYPRLIPIDKVLFKSLFAETVYEENLRPTIKKLITDAELLDLKTKLEKDMPAIATLSTFAVNFFYNLSHYFKNDRLFDPTFFLNIAKKEYVGSMASNLNLKLYLLTHAIIGESAFYSKKITRHKKTYLQMIKLCENIILENYFSISLDNKFEFLVCANMLNHKTLLRKLVLNEADRSLADNGNFLIGKLNDAQGTLTRNLLDAEHRNVLFLMANLKQSGSLLKK